MKQEKNIDYFQIEGTPAAIRNGAQTSGCILAAVVH